MASFLEREQLLPVAPSIAPADQILGAFNTKQSLFGIGAAQLKSAYNSYSQMQLSNPQNQMQLDGLLKQASTDLKGASVTDLSVGDNQSKALTVFDPINKDQDILGDNTLTMSWNRSKSQAESARVSNGGKNFSQSSLDAVNYQQALYSKSDKSTWKTFYNNKESYSPYYNTQDEMGKLTKLFKSDVIEKDSQNGAYITTTKDSSWYKDKWQQFFEANASPQLKSQVGQASRAEYYRDMLTMPREAIVQKYTDLRNGLIRKQMNIDAGNLMNIGAQLALKHDSKDNNGQRAALIAQANYLNDAYGTKRSALNSPLEGADAIGTVDGMSVATRMVEGLGQYKYFDKIGDAFAHKEEKFSIKPDYAYLSLKKLSEQAKEFGIRQSEVGRHNRASEQHMSNMEQIDLMKAQADLIRANKTGTGKNGSGTGGSNGMFDDDGSGSNVLRNTNDISAGSNSEKDITEGQNILDHLGSIQKKYDDVYDKTAHAVFGQGVMAEIDKLVNDPASQRLTLRDVADPTKAPDGSGGITNRVAKFIAAAGAVTAEGSAVLTNPAAAYSLTLPQVKEKLRHIFSDPAMLQKGIEAIKGNDPSISSYATAASIEKQKQRIDGENADITSQAISKLRTNLEGSASLFEKDYFSKGKIPTKDEVRSVLNNVPTSALRGQVDDNRIFKAPSFESQDDYYRGLATNKVTETILKTLGANRTAYNTRVERFIPDKGSAARDTKFEQGALHFIQGAEGQTKGLGSGVLYALKYAREHPDAIDRIDMNTVNEASNLPTMQIYFNKTASAGKDPLPEQGVPIPTTNAPRRFSEVPLDDRTLLLNNKALKFQSKYNDGSTSNLSIYNASGDKSNPQFDINPDFSYKTLDIDPRTGDIKGVREVYRSEEINNLTRGNPGAFPQAIAVDPTTIYNTLANKLIKNRDAVNEYLKSNGSIKNINDLPEYIKTALKTPF